MSNRTSRRGCPPEMETDQMLERLGQSHHAVSDRRILRREKDGVVLQVAKEEELTGDLVSPRTNDVELFVRQTGRVFVYERLYEVRLFEESVPHFEPSFGR